MSTRRARIDVAVLSRAWKQGERAHVATVRRAARTALAAALTTRQQMQADISVALLSDARMRTLNRRFRGKDTPTNVLSFPAFAADALPAAGPAMLGDIALAFETTAREAAAEGKAFAAHLAHLTVHGVLHLLGYDHLKERDAVAMENLERRILGRLDIPDPYAGAMARRPPRRTSRRP
jgi:probable rRNA maturation factor